MAAASKTNGGAKPLDATRISKWFRCSAGVILAITGIVKLWGAFFGPKIMTTVDPIFGLQFGQLIVMAGLLELGTAFSCLAANSEMSLMLIGWLATTLAAYRFGLWAIDWHHPCHCLGNLTDAVHIPPQMADSVMKFVLAYLLFGSYATLFLLSRHRRKIERKIHNDELKAET